MRSKRDLDAVDNLQTEEYITEADSLNMDTFEDDKELVLQSIAELAESGLGILHRLPGQVQRLYLVPGGVFRLGDSGVTRLS
jgi:hypothetical protein